jgi:hypothetical protein
MSNGQKVGIAAVIALVAMSLVAWRAVVARQTAETARATLLAQRSDLETRLRRWEAEDAAAKQRPAEQATDSAKAAPAKSPGPAEAPKAKASAAPSLTEWLDLLDNDPKFQVLHLAQKRAELAMSYGPFFRMQGLSSEQIGKLSDLLINGVAQVEDLRAIAWTTGLSSRDPAIAAQQKQGMAELQAAETELLGTAGGEQLQQYERALPAWTYVGQLAGVAALAGVSFNREQAARLTDAIANASAVYVRGGTVDFARVDWKAADVSAQAFLSPEQFTLFSRTDPPGAVLSRRTSQIPLTILQAGQRTRKLPTRPGG